MARPQLPPGPRGRPFIGSLPEFLADPPGFLQLLARGYGDVAYFRKGWSGAWQLSHPDFIKQVLVTEADNFAKTGMMKKMRRIAGDGLLTSGGALHKRQRGLLQPAFARRELERFQPEIARIAARHCASWRGGMEVRIDREMQRLCLAVSARIFLGVDAADGAAAREAEEAVDGFFDYARFAMFPCSEWIERLPLPRFRRFQTDRERLDAFIGAAIARHRARPDDYDDLLADLLRDREAAAAMSDRQIRDEVVTLFLAGHETIATALTWTCYLLALNPAAEARVEAEAAEADGAAALPYTRMAFTEAMRLYPPVWAMSRRAIAPFRVGGYDVPAGAFVGVSQYVTHRDPRFYSDPERFEPLRWTPEERRKRPAFAYFPFGAGPRACIGESMAWMEGLAILTAIARDWRMRLVPGQDLSLQPALTLRPRHGIRMRLERRNALPAPAHALKIARNSSKMRSNSFV